MQQLHDELVRCPDICQAHAHTCDTVHDSTSLAGMGSNLPPHFWQQLQHVRSDILQQKPNAARQASMGDPLQDGFGLQAPSSPEPKTPRKGSDHSQLRFADLAETHAHMLHLRILGTVRRCNFRFSHTTCCIHHAAVEVLRDAQVALAMQSCQQSLSVDRNQLMLQCPQCTMLEQAGNITEVEDFECIICGFSGMPATHGVAEGSEEQDTELSQLSIGQAQFSVPSCGTRTTLMQL